MNDEWTALDDAIEEVREVRRRLWAEFDNDPVKFHEHLVEYQKQFEDRLVTREQLDARRAENSDRSAA